MRGGRNKFGPMYKRDRARKLQMIRQRQLAAQTLHGSLGGSGGVGATAGADPLYQPSQVGSGTSSGGGSAASSSFPNIHIKQEIQIPQVSSLTSSPDSSPSPIAVALSQVNNNMLGNQMGPNSNQQPALQIVGVPSGGMYIFCFNKYLQHLI